MNYKINLQTIKSCIFDKFLLKIYRELIHG